MKPTDITPRQQQVLDMIRQYIAANGVPPTYREIGAALGIKSPNGVRGDLGRLERKGLIVMRAGKARTIRVVGDDSVSSRLLDVCKEAAKLLRSGCQGQARRVLEAAIASEEGQA